MHVDRNLHVRRSSLTLTMIVLLGIEIVSTVAVSYFVISIFWPMFTGGAGYTPTPKNVAVEALEACQLKKEDVFYDLGCGTGGVLVEASKVCDHVKGIEIEPIRWFISKLRAGRKAEVILGDLFKQDISDADVIFMFQYTGKINSRIADKIRAETRRGTRVVSYIHPVENMQLIRSRKEIFVYQV